MATPSISIVVPSYNQGHLIRHTLDSILAQNVPDMEIVVIDGGSRDDTVEVLKSYGDRIRWTSEKDKGQSDAINKGLRQVHGDILAYINSDDTYEPGAIRRALETFEAHPDVDFIYGDANFIDGQGRLIRAMKAVDFDPGILFYDHNYICQPASFWRRSVTERIGLFDESLYYFMDYDFFLRAARADIRFMHLREPLANLRFHSSCKTVSGSNQDTENMNRVRTEILDRYRPRFGPAWFTRPAHLALKIFYRFKKLVKDMFENGQLSLTSYRRLMKRVHAGKY